MTMGNLNLDKYRPSMYKFVITMYLSEILPLYRKIYEQMRRHRIWRKEQVELILIRMNRRRITREILQKTMNMNCIDNVMEFL